MSITLRRATMKDAQAVGRIYYRAFTDIAERHGFKPDFANQEECTLYHLVLLGDRGYHSMIAERDGVPIGASFLDVRGPVAGAAGLAVEPGVAGAGIAALMLEENSIDVCRERGTSLRGLVATYHRHGFGLDHEFGFKMRQILLWLEGDPLNESVEGIEVRQATLDDLDACNALCARIYGFERHEELRLSIRRKSATVAIRDGAIRGYWAWPGTGHAVGESNDDLKALIAAASSFGGGGPILPADNIEVFEWCFSRGFRAIRTMALLCWGDYTPPSGPYFASTVY